MCVFFWNKKCIFSYTFDLCGQVGDKKFFTRQISGNKTTLFFCLSCMILLFASSLLCVLHFQLSDDNNFSIGIKTIGQVCLVSFYFSEIVLLKINSWPSISLQNLLIIYSKHKPEVALTKIYF